MTATVMKQIDFCAGHRLVGHGGKCASLHGHNYCLEVYVAAEQLDRLGRVIDFADIRDLFKQWIDEHWDHGIILASDDDNGIRAVRQSQPHKLFLLPGPPTAENMALFLMSDVAPRLLNHSDLNQRQVRVAKIVLWESPTSCAEVTAPRPQDRIPSDDQSTQRLEGECDRSQPAGRSPVEAAPARRSAAARQRMTN